MALVRCMRLGMLLPLLVGALSIACGGDDDENDGPAERIGPDGCYLVAEMRCDCALEEADCTAEGQVWTDGCTSCAM